MFSELNFIYFQFRSEKQEYKINFETTEISLFDIKRKIIERRNMNKFPEKFELIFFDKNLNLINEDMKNDSIKIQPHTKLYVKRVPFYMLSHSFRQIIYDKKDEILNSVNNIDNNNNNNNNNNLNYETKQNDVVDIANISCFTDLINFVNKRYIKNFYIKNQEFNDTNNICLDDVTKKKLQIFCNNLLSLDRIKSLFLCDNCFINKHSEINYKDTVANYILSCCGECVCETCINNMQKKNNKTKKTVLNNNNTNNELEKETKTQQNSNIISQCDFCLKENVRFLKNINMQKFYNEILYLYNNINNYIDISNNNNNINSSENDINKHQPYNKLDNVVLNNNINKSSSKNITNSNYTLDNPTLNNNPLYLTNKFNMSIIEELLDKSRFILIKSSNSENVRISQNHNEWATTVGNQRRVNDTFFQKESLILIFSTSKAKSFQGFALMTSNVTDKIASYWNNENRVKLGGCFSIQWLVTCELHYNKVSNLINTLNNEAVINCKDATEIDKLSGKQLCITCLDKETEDILSNNQKRHFNIDANLNKVIMDIKNIKERFFHSNNQSNFNQRNYNNNNNIGKMYFKYNNNDNYKSNNYYNNNNMINSNNKDYYNNGNNSYNNQNDIINRERSRNKELN